LLQEACPGIFQCSRVSGCDSLLAVTATPGDVGGVWPLSHWLVGAATETASDSIWEKLLPALAAGVAGILAALISAAVALASYRRTFKQSREAQSNQLAISLLPRRLDAFEKIWIAIYRLQRGEQLSEPEADGVVGATVWVPPDIRDSTARLLGAPDDEALIAELRQKLLQASGADEIDVAIARLRDGKR
jgi:hypothetical protein